MTIRIDVYHHLDFVTPEVISQLIQKVDTLMINAQEAEARLAAAVTRLAKVEGEVDIVIATVAQLRAELEAAGGITPGIETQLVALEASAMRLDDKNPDAPPVA